METKNLDWETVKIFVKEYAWVQEGEDLLIVYDEDTDREVLDMVVEACKGQRVKNLVLLQAPPPKKPEGTVEGAWLDAKFRPIPPIIFEAVKAADRTISFSETLRGTHHNFYAYNLVYYYGKPLYANAERLIKHLGSEAIPPRFPRELLKQIFERVRDKLWEATASGKSLRITHPWGTDLIYTALPGNVAPIYMVPEFPPSKKFLCYDSRQIVRAVIGTNPPDTANGVVVSKYCKDIGGMLKEPVKFTIIDGWCEKVEGGKEAEQIRNILGEDRYNRRLQEIHIGLNPKVSTFTKKGELTYEGTCGAGNLHMALGREEADYAGGKWLPSSSQHITIAYLPKINWWIGEELLVENGRLKILDDPEIIKLASQYGDPKRLFKQADWPEKDIPK